ncbi:hypothetical protein F5X68DRAFT_260970 [Plectosphaerella plurivora]|uniref:Uncharacterized protein n=1 Tax=Plectosphaerella plurivora TaxID=936078 RepID=A0A9P8VCI9_9PEZI|nr:hypothetical protein F5X68DRAFT_260970 [Plectosphaerella plurivora]
MSGLLDDLFSPPSQQSAGPPLLGPILGGGDDATSATTTPTPRLQPLPTGTPSEASTPAPVRTGNADANPESPSDDAGSQQSTTTQPPVPSTTATRPRPTFIITDSPSDASPTTSDLPPPLSPSAVPSLPATPDPDDVLIVAPSPTAPLVIPTDLLAAPTTLLTLTSSAIPLPTSSALPGDAEAALADPSANNNAMASLMPALPISLGIGGGVLFFGVIGGLLYKKGVWPFRGDREREGRFEELEDGSGNAATAEKQFQRKWDPRVSGVGVFTTRTNGATNF